MAIELEQKTKRMINGSIFLPQHLWDWIGVEEEGECYIGVDKSKHGKYVAIYTKNHDESEGVKEELIKEAQKNGC